MSISMRFDCAAACVASIIAAVEIFKSLDAEDPEAHRHTARRRGGKTLNKSVVVPVNAVLCVLGREWGGLSVLCVELLTVTGSRLDLGQAHRVQGEGVG
jgi:hypothetical protein